jgi:phosphopantothenoylcysteine decarboxylase/phosphopantothenate--cysteine ligase
VADWRVANPSTSKIKKPYDGAGAGRQPDAGDKGADRGTEKGPDKANDKANRKQGGVPTLELVENPDILASVARRSGAPYCVGFAAESEDLVRHAQQKRLRKGVPLIVANIGPDTFGSDDNEIVLVDEAGAHELGRGSKDSLATLLVAEISRRLE